MSLRSLLTAVPSTRRTISGFDRIPNLSLTFGSLNMINKYIHLPESSIVVLRSLSLSQVVVSHCHAFSPLAYCHSDTLWTPWQSTMRCSAGNPYKSQRFIQLSWVRRELKTYCIEKLPKCRPATVCSTPITRHRIQLETITWTGLTQISEHRRTLPSLTLHINHKIQTHVNHVPCRRHSCTTVTCQCALDMFATTAPFETFGISSAHNDGAH